MSEKIYFGSGKVISGKYGDFLSVYITKKTAQNQ